MPKEILYIVLIYLAVINLVGFIITIVDKQKAKHRKWRIKESALFSVAILGGSVFMYIAMLLFHHKTKHKRFMIVIPVIIFIQLALAFLIYEFLK